MQLAYRHECYIEAAGVSRPEANGFFYYYYYCSSSALSNTLETQLFQCASRDAASGWLQSA